MFKEKIFEIIMQAEPADIAPLADKMRQVVDYHVISPPQQELVMFRAEESVEKIDFNVGEVLVTSAEVRVEDAIGYSMIMDTDKQRALDCALLMGIYDAGLPQMKEIEKLAEIIHGKMQQTLREEREIVSSTRVNFEVMGGQDPNIAHNVE
ncbi:MAG: phosphonate C-P lyase system protein PhnG [Desulfobacterales bacterium]|jgi:alpha-D-ribose 1-methylphosphonate 5-triphosphate synthase subunit PhnG